MHPGEEFSFNAAWDRGQRQRATREQPPITTGEVVQEIGGGVCQVSTTLYNAVYRSGLGEESITFRRSHTFEPNYITPGQDATVSWEQPDFRFRNTSSTSIGIKASYAGPEDDGIHLRYSDLEEGTKLDLVSEKSGGAGSRRHLHMRRTRPLSREWRFRRAPAAREADGITYKVLYKDGKEVSREQDHKTTYKGHAPVIRRNTTGVVLPPEETTLFHRDNDANH